MPWYGSRPTGGRGLRVRAPRKIGAELELRSFYQRLEGLEATPHLPDEDLVERTRG